MHLWLLSFIFHNGYLCAFIFSHLIVFLLYMCSVLCTFMCCLWRNKRW